MLNPSDFAAIQQIVRQRSGIELDEAQVYLAETRLQPVLRQRGLASIAELVRRARGNDLASRALEAQLVDALTTNETSFFRDKVPFQVLERVVFPGLEGRTGIRIWSAACSTGQEAYSIALVLAERFPSLARSVQILGTDISPTVVERARAGCFSQNEVSRGLPPGTLNRHFRQDGTCWRLVPTVRRMVRFDVGNLLDPMPLGAFDVIFLRNVLIYFSPSTRDGILRRVRKVMRPGGWLFVGGSEVSAPPADVFQRETHLGVHAFRPR
ncbi:MAG: protein-glutamate O-methyltransferase CheR [Myxococcales bacterium]|nr:protein-glutamate O-methyltransferase CheR [Myxococcales bacterium]